MTNRPRGHDDWTVWDPERENLHLFDTRGEAESKIDMAENLGIPAELYPPGESPEAMFHAETGDPDPEDQRTDDATDLTADESVQSETESDGGQPVPDPQDAEPAPDPTSEPAVVETTVQSIEEVSETPKPPLSDAEGELPERSIAEDPLTWVPGEFVDDIDGTQAINRKGFEVLSHFYDIGVAATVEVAPEETGHEYCRVKATATTADGRTCEAFGSAHVDRGDDYYLLLEMADTRARKRALSIATGVGAVAVAELRNELEGSR